MFRYICSCRTTIRRSLFFAFRRLVLRRCFRLVARDKEASNANSSVEAGDTALNSSMVMGAALILLASAASESW